MKFQATVELNGQIATGIEAPEDVVTALGSTRRTTRIVYNHLHTDLAPAATGLAAAARHRRNQ